MQNKIIIHPARQAPAEPGQVSPTNLPVQLTPLIGRESEVVQVRAQLSRPEVRLLTLSGTGGVGKTRLALQAASELVNDFPDGVFFISLAPISDSDLVVPAIAQTLDLWEARDQSPLNQLQVYLREKRPLLLLDNFEQVVTAASLLSELLKACPELKILVTSRAVLRLYGEYEYVVPPLALPDLKHLPTPEKLAHTAAVALFLQRAQAIKHDFQVTATNARAIAEICTHLDGLPLAIELAAARINLLSPQALLARLTKRLQVLTSGARNLPTRQQTLRSTLQWSYDLLDVEEQRLFRRLSIFVGGCSLSAVENMSATLDDGDTAVPVLDAVASLIDKSLLQQIEQEGGEPRLKMLETVREYGLESLEASGEIEGIRQTHATYYLRLAEEAELEFHGSQQAEWLARIEREYDNLRAALAWAVEQRGELALRLASALQVFWVRRGHLSEGWLFLNQALERSEDITATVRAKALVTASCLTTLQGDYKQAAALGEDGLRLYQQIADRQGVARALYQLGLNSISRDDFVAARPLLEEAVALFKEAGDMISIAWSLMRLASVSSAQDQFDRAEVLYLESLTLLKEWGDKEGMMASLLELARTLLVSQDDLGRIHQFIEKSLAISQEIESKFGLAYSLELLAELALRENDPSIALSRIEESMSLFRELGCQQYYIAQQLLILAKAKAAQGEYTAAYTLYEESLAGAREEDDSLTFLSSLEGLAQVVALQGEFVWAARLWGAAETLHEASGVSLTPVERADHERSIAALRTQLGEYAFTAAWTEGRSMTPEHILSAGRATTSTPTPFEQPTKPSLHYPAGLTAREVEVLRLVAQGLTNPQIAAQLVISLHTVNAHVRSIFNKLDVSSRNGVTRFAIEHCLV